MTNIQNVKTGTVEIPEEDFDPKTYKVRITIMVDGDILDTYKKTAEEQHTKYQTLMNSKLREGMSDLGGQPSMKNVMEKIEALTNRMTRLEGNNSRREITSKAGIRRAKGKNKYVSTSKSGVPHLKHRFK